MSLNPPEPMIDLQTEIGPQSWLDSAQAAIRAYCGWHVAPIQKQILTIDGNGLAHLLLPTMRIVNVYRVTIDGEDVTERVNWSESGMLKLSHGHFPCRFRAVEVELEHGFMPSEVPQIGTLALNIAQRASNQPKLRRQSVNGATVEYLTAGGAPLSISLLEIEKQSLEPFRLKGRIA